MSAHHDDRHAREDRRNEFALRRQRATAGELERLLDRVHGEVLRLQREQPHLLAQDAVGLWGRAMVPETAPGYESLLRRCAFMVLAVRAADRAETVDPTSGGEAA